MGEKIMTQSGHCYLKIVTCQFCKHWFNKRDCPRCNGQGVLRLKEQRSKPACMATNYDKYSQTANDLITKFHEPEVSKLNYDDVQSWDSASDHPFSAQKARENRWINAQNRNNRAGTGGRTQMLRTAQVPGGRTQMLRTAHKAGPGRKLTVIADPRKILQRGGIPSTISKNPSTISFTTTLNT